VKCCTINMDESERPQPLKTILVVDRDPKNLSFVAGFLDGKYDVLTANSSPNALLQSKNFKSEIYLLLADLQMAGISGIELATQITVQRPAIKVLLMSDIEGGMLVLNEGWHFLPRPFIPSQLLTLVAGLISEDPKSRFSGLSTH